MHFPLRRVFVCLLNLPLRRFFPSLSLYLYLFTLYYTPLNREYPSFWCSKNCRNKYIPLRVTSGDFLYPPFLFYSILFYSFLFFSLFNSLPFFESVPLPAVRDLLRNRKEKKRTEQKKKNGASTFFFFFPSSTSIFREDFLQR